MTQASPDPKASPQARPMVDTGFDDADIAVVGAGVVGTACALALARQGLRVRVLDSDAPGMGRPSATPATWPPSRSFPLPMLLC